MISIRLKSLLLVIYAIVSFAIVNGALADDRMGPVARTISKKMLQADTQNRFSCREEMVCGIALIPQFYRQRDYIPAWTLDGKIRYQTDQLIEALQNAEEEGLSPEIYHLSLLEDMVAEIRDNSFDGRPPNVETLAELDILLTDAFLLYSSHLRAGRVNPETVHTAWHAFHPELDLLAVLRQALASGTIDMSIATQVTPQPGYQRLKKALQRYHRIAVNGGWSDIAPGATLHPGDNDPRVPDLRQRLAAAGDLATTKPSLSPIFDNALEEAVRRFQQRHGLEDDGIVGSQTLAELNISVKERIRQIELNMERWRWVPRDMGDRHILVNIAGFYLQVIEKGWPVLEMQVVVGREYRRTPVFSASMTYLVLNPYWNVPFRIAVEDKLPLIQKDPAYLSEHHFRVLTGWEKNAGEVDPDLIDWQQLSRHNFTYRLRQDPGPHNALGRVKFMFPNHYAVYLHDTPQRELFERISRALSSGCIRLEKPRELALYLLSDHPMGDQKQFDQALDKNHQQVVFLKTPMPTHLLYWTAWANRYGTVHFRRDIYGRDLPLDKALKEALPEP